MGSSSSKNASPTPKLLSKQTLASIARLWNNGDHNSRGLIHYRQDVDLREELEVTKRMLEEKTNALTQERDKAKEEIALKSQALAAAQRERDEVKAQMDALDKKSKVLSNHIEGLNEQLGKAQDQALRLKEQLTRREAEVRIATNEVEQTKLLHSQTIALLDTRTAELKGAQAFLTKADSTSGADVVRMIEGLDAEIHQTAAFMADHFVFDERQEMTDEVKEACERIGELIGPKMVDLLGSTEHAEDPMLIQLACQASASAYCRWIILSWDFEDHNFDQFLRHIYMTVQGAESQAIAGRWRALTRTHVQSMLHGNSDVSSSLVPHIAESMVDILLAAGLRATPDQVHEVMMTTFGEKLTTIVQLALGLNWVIGKEITSADLDPVSVESKAVFDPATMDDVNGEGARKVGGEAVVEYVLCTTDLGLQRVVKPSKAEGDSQWETILLLKPKVALESVLDNSSSSSSSSEVSAMQITESPESITEHELAPNGH